MNFRENLRGILFGAVVILGGYVLDMLVVYGTILIDSAHWSWIAGVMAILLAASSGFVGALFAQSRPLVVGVTSSFVGGLTLLTLLGAFAPTGIDVAFIGPLLVVCLLAFGGAFIAVYVWPRHGI